MFTDISIDLPDEQRLALAYAPARSRQFFRLFLALDNRLAGIVRSIREPLLAQMRLAWWRDELAKELSLRAKGDPILDEIGISWRGEEPALRSLIDGWEELLVEPPFPASAPANFADGRAQVCGAIARLSGARDNQDEVMVTARRWALADLAAKLTDPVETTVVLAEARSLGDAAGHLPRSMRPLAVLDELARRSIAADGAPLLASRGDALRAMRLGLFGK